MEPCGTATEKSEESTCFISAARHSQGAKKSEAEGIFSCCFLSYSDFLGPPTVWPRLPGATR
jgi:hypothetical protein